MVQAAMARTGGDKSNGEVQIAIAEATKSQDGQAVDQAMKGFNTDDDNEKAIQNSLSSIKTDEEKEQ